MSVSISNASLVVGYCCIHNAYHAKNLIEALQRVLHFKLTGISLHGRKIVRGTIFCYGSIPELEFEFVEDRLVHKNSAFIKTELGFWLAELKCCSFAVAIQYLLNYKFFLGTRPDSRCIGFRVYPKNFVAIHIGDVYPAAVIVMRIDCE